MISTLDAVWTFIPVNSPCRDIVVLQYRAWEVGNSLGEACCSVSHDGHIAASYVVPILIATVGCEACNILGSKVLFSMCSTFDGEQWQQRGALKEIAQAKKLFSH